MPTDDPGRSVTEDADGAPVAGGDAQQGRLGGRPNGRNESPRSAPTGQTPQQQRPGTRGPAAALASEGPLAASAPASAAGSDHESGSSPARRQERVSETSPAAAATSEPEPERVRENGIFKGRVSNRVEKTELRRRRRAQTPNASFSDDSSGSEDVDMEETRKAFRFMIAAGVAAIALTLFTVAMAVLWWRATPLDAFPLARRLPMNKCLPVSEQHWRNGTVLEHKLKTLTGALERHLIQKKFQGLSASHLGVPACVMAVRGRDPGDAPEFLLNVVVVGTSKRTIVTKEQSSLCPDVEFYGRRNARIVVQYRRADDYEEMEREFADERAHTIQQLLDAQQGVNPCE